MEIRVWPEVRTKLVPHFLLALCKPCIFFLKYFLPYFQTPSSSTSMRIPGHDWGGLYEELMLTKWLISWRSPSSFQFSRNPLCPSFKEGTCIDSRKHLDAELPKCTTTHSASLGIHPHPLPGARNRCSWVSLISLSMDKDDAWSPKVEISCFISTVQALLACTRGEGGILAAQGKGMKLPPTSLERTSFHRERWVQTVAITFPVFKELVLTTAYKLMSPDLQFTQQQLACLNSITSAFTSALFAMN